MTDDIFKELPERLKAACGTSLERYQRFLENDPGDDPKRSVTYYQAAKSAVTHMTALIKLMQLFDKLHPTKEKGADLESLLRQARQVLAVQNHDQENQL